MPSLLEVRANQGLPGSMSHCQLLWPFCIPTSLLQLKQMSYSLGYFLSSLYSFILSHLLSFFHSFLCPPSYLHLSLLAVLPFLSSYIHLLTPPFLFFVSSVQLYDLGSPADSHSSSPGCLTTDSSCVNMGYPSCGQRGRCHGEWGSFSCQCVPGYTGRQCEEGISI